jgi:hypothetical protein
VCFFFFFLLLLLLFWLELFASAAFLRSLFASCAFLLAARLSIDASTLLAATSSAVISLAGAGSCSCDFFAFAADVSAADGAALGDDAAVAAACFVWLLLRALRDGLVLVAVAVACVPRPSSVSWRLLFAWGADAGAASLTPLFGLFHGASRLPIVKLLVDRKCN